ncbi:hypothetical protein HAX54_038418, partial [Datura stramonium]|nr:hypothetical protein [Datura stramonium]
EPLILSYKITGAAQDDTMKKMFLFGQQHVEAAADTLPIDLGKNHGNNHDNY